MAGGVSSNSTSARRRGSTASILAGYSVMSKSIMGAGILSVAYACAPYGLVGGIIVVLFAAAITGFSLEVLARLGSHSGLQPVTFYGVSKFVLPHAAWVFDAANILDCIVCAVAYIQYSGNLLKSVARSGVSSDSISDDSLLKVMMLVTVVAAFPMCMLSQISHTMVMNYLGLACLAIVLVLSLVYVGHDSVESPDISTILWPSSWAQMLARFTTLLFAFACHQTLFAVMSDLGREVAATKTSWIVLSAVGTSLCVYLPLMIVPLLKYGNDTKASFLLNLPGGNNGVYAVLGLASFVVTANFVLSIIPMRLSIYSLLGVSTHRKALTPENNMSRGGSQEVIGCPGMPEQINAVSTMGSVTGAAYSPKISSLVNPSSDSNTNSVRRTIASDSSARSSDAAITHLVRKSRFESIADWMRDLPEPRLRLLIVSSTSIIALGLALLPIDLSLALELGGIIGCNTLCYLLPAYLYYKQFGVSRKSVFSMLNYALLIFSALLYPLCLGAIAYTTATGQ